MCLLWPSWDQFENRTSRSESQMEMASTSRQQHHEAMCIHMYIARIYHMTCRKLSIESVLAICHVNLPLSSSFFAYRLLFLYFVFLLFVNTCCRANFVVSVFVLFFFVLFPNFIDNSNGRVSYKCVNFRLYLVFFFFLFASFSQGISQNIVYFLFDSFLFGFRWRMFFYEPEQRPWWLSKGMGYLLFKLYNLKCVTKSLGEIRVSKVCRAKKHKDTAFQMSH